VINIINPKNNKDIIGPRGITAAASPRTPGIARLDDGAVSYRGDNHDETTVIPSPEIYINPNQPRIE
jgi:hypothetical protein